MKPTTREDLKKFYGKDADKIFVKQVIGDGDTMVEAAIDLRIPDIFISFLHSDLGGHTTSVMYTREGWEVFKKQVEEFTTEVYSEKPTPTDSEPREE